MIGSRFYIDFQSDNTGQVEISEEPVGLDAADFAIIQEDGRMGRDIQYAGGKARFQFSRMMHPEVFDILQRYDTLFGFEAIAKLGIDYGGIGQILIIGNIDFSTSDNNTFDLFKCDVILDQDKSMIKRNIEVKTDLFSNVNVDGGVIASCVPMKILIKPKPLSVLTRWESISNDAFTLAQGSTQEPGWFNKIKKITVSGIDGDLTWLSDYYQGDDVSEISKFRILKAQTTLVNVKAIIKKNLSTQWISNPPFDNAIQVQGYIFKGTTATWLNDFNSQGGTSQFYNTGALQNGNANYNDNGTIEFDLGTIETGQEIFFVFRHGSNGNDISRTTYGNTSLEISASSIDYPSVNNAVRLIDAIRYNVKSAGNSIVYFPMAEQGGYLYNQFIFNGNLLRNLTEKPFYLMFKDIVEWFPELNLDYEIQADGVIFIGGYDDFYPDYQMAEIDNVVFDDYSKSNNEEFKINIFNYGYESYQSQKENDVANTYDGVHAETQLKLFNKSVNNKKEIKVKFIRDPFFLEENRIKAFRKQENSATQDDDKIFILDVYPSSSINSSAIFFTETDLLQHSFDTVTGLLTLRNTGNFRFDILGIQVGGGFAITTTSPQLNSGIYTVVEVSSNYLVLQPFGSTTPTTANNGERYTRFTYQVPVSSIAGVNWTNQEFSLIENIANPNEFSNLRFSVGRNLEKYHPYLATSNLYHSQLPARNVFYKNNPEAFTVLNGIPLKEGEHTVPLNPILSPKNTNIKFILTFDFYYNLMQDIRSDRRGYIKCEDPDGNVLKLYPKDMKFKSSMETEGELTMIGKDKYQRYLVNITDSNQGFITINGENTMQFLRYEIINNYFYIKDQNGVLLYKRLLFNQIAVNEAIASNETELIQWLNLLTE